MDCRTLHAQALQECSACRSAEHLFTARKYVFPLTDTWAPCRPAGPQRPASLELQAQRTSCAVTPTIRSNQLNSPLPSTYIARATHFVLLHVANATVGDKPSSHFPQPTHQQREDAVVNGCLGGTAKTNTCAFQNLSCNSVHNYLRSLLY